MAATLERLQYLNLRPFLTAKEAAELTGVGEQYIRAMAAESGGKIAFHIGKKLMLKRESMLLYMNELEDIVI